MLRSAMCRDASSIAPRLREALVPVLTEGSWEQIEDDHKKVGLAWLLAPE